MSSSTPSTNGHVNGNKGSMPLHRHLSTIAIHADDLLNTTIPDVAPPIHLSSTFHYSSDPSQLVPARDQPSPHPTDAHVYSRETTPNTTRLELLLAGLLHADCVCYGSGLAALHALYVFLNPKRVAIGLAYHGTHGVLGLHAKVSGAKILGLDCPEEDLHEGDVVHLETPVNPTGEAFSIRKYAEKAHRRGAVLVVDSTFAAPGLQDPFVQGADVVMHSGTKYLGGHSDLLWGVLSTENHDWIRGLREERTYLGSVMGGLESWLGVRSLRTLELRVQRQSENATKLVEWLSGVLEGTAASEGDGQVVKDLVESVKHASLQKADMVWLKEQMPGGFGPVFVILMKEEAFARRFPSKLTLFHHATSLGGVESLIEWRAMSDTHCDPRICRVSVGAEHWEDLRDDLLAGLKALHNEEKRNGA